MSAAAVLIVMASLLLPSLAKAKSKGRSIAYRHDAPQVALVTRLDSQPADEPADEPADVLLAAQSQIDPVAGMPMRGEPEGATEGRERQLQQTYQPGGAPRLKGVEVAAKAESSGAESAQPMADIRMLMRYGLLPKGMKLVEDAGESAAASGLAKAVEKRKTDAISLGESVAMQPQPEASTPVPSAPARSELAPLPLELPAPGLVAPPTAGLAFADGEAKNRAAEIRGGEESAGAITWGGTVAKYGDMQQNWHVQQHWDIDAPAKGALVNGFYTAGSGGKGGGGMGGMGLTTNVAVSAEELEANGRVAGDVVVKGVPRAASRPSAPPPEPQPEVATAVNPFSTFSLNVTDVSFKLAAASLEQGALPVASRIRSEEFLNAFNYRDPEPVRGAPVAFAWERARYPFAHNREAIRFSVQTAARGRSALRPLNLVLLLDSSGSMERADRVAIVREALSVLAQKLEAQDRISVVAFARTARLWVDGVSGSQAREVLDEINRLTPEGGTNLEDALNVAYETAARHFVSHGVNRVVLLTDGAANLGDVDPESLKQKVESARKKGIALDCFGIGWEGYNDDLLEVLSSHGDGRYGFVNSPEEAATGLAEQLAGALEVAAADVKVQVEFNPQRATAWRQIGYAKHQLTKEQFRDNTVDAAELGAAESGNALYILELNPRGQGDVGTVRVRYREAASGLYREHAWRVPYTGPAPGLEESSPAMRLAVTSAAFAEWLASSPFAGEVTPDKLLGAMAGVTDAFGPDARPRQLETMLRAAKAISGQ